MKPVAISTTISQNMAQNTNFWPRLYLPSSGSLSSSPLTTAPILRAQTASSRRNRLWRTSCTNRTMKLTNSAMPMNGWTQRVAWPPPNSDDSQ